MAKVARTAQEESEELPRIDGLTTEEAVNRLKQFGYNEVLEKKTGFHIKFGKKFWGVTPWMLELTVVLEWFLGKYTEAYFIAGLLTFNAIVGYLQEERANSAVALLRTKLTVNARVKRDGQWALLPSSNLVPGDLIRLRAGDMTPADTKLLDGNVDVDQSALTGESLAIERKRGEVLYSGSVVKRGEATGVVSATGLKTYFGKTAELVQIARPKLHIEEMIGNVVRWLLIMVAVSIVAWLGFAVLQGVQLSEIAPLTVVLLVSAIPVAMPTMFTISMALGSYELSRRGAIVTRLDAIEDAATMDVLCADKTGTITWNRLVIADVFPVGLNKKADVILFGALAAQEANQDPIDLAFITKARELNLHVGEYKQLRFTPFDPQTRRTEATLTYGDTALFVTKGAVDTIIHLCKDCQDDIDTLHREVEILSGGGYRVLAVAQGSTSDEAELVGFAALYDKPREDSPKLISELKRLGVRVKMLTGDALPIAKEVAAHAGLGDNITKIPDLKRDPGDPESLRLLEESDGFAEVYPEDKYLIVKGLQLHSHFVGMTGDGVNDAPALRQAEVGIAVSNATDIAKQASSVVLTEEGFEGILDMVVVGRMVYQRITSWTINKIIRTFKRVVFIVLAFILTGQFVVSTLNMILLLFLSDYVTLSISTDKVRPSPAPEKWNSNALVKLGIVYASFIVVESLGILYIGMYWFRLAGDLLRLQTFVFVWLTLSGYYTVLSIRERRHFWDSTPSKWLALALAINSVLVFIISTVGISDLTPIDPTMYLFILVYGFFTCLLLNDFVKVPLAKDLNVQL